MDEKIKEKLIKGKIDCFNKMPIIHLTAHLINKRKGSNCNELYLFTVH